MSANATANQTPTPTAAPAAPAAPATKHTSLFHAVEAKFHNLGQKIETAFHKLWPQIKADLTAELATVKTELTAFKAELANLETPASALVTAIESKNAAAAEAAFKNLASAFGHDAEGAAESAWHTFVADAKHDLHLAATPIAPVAAHVGVGAPTPVAPATAAKHTSFLSNLEQKIDNLGQIIEKSAVAAEHAIATEAHKLWPQIKADLTAELATLKTELTAFKAELANLETPASALVTAIESKNAAAAEAAFKNLANAFGHDAEGAAESAWHTFITDVEHDLHPDAASTAPVVAHTSADAASSAAHTNDDSAVSDHFVDATGVDALTPEHA